MQFLGDAPGGFRWSEAMERLNTLPGKSGPGLGTVAFLQGLIIMWKRGFSLSWQPLCLSDDHEVLTLYIQVKVKKKKRVD